MFGLSEDLVASITSIFDKYQGITKAILFCSRAMGNYKNGSDIDILIEGESLQSKDIEKLLLQMDELEMPYYVDLVLAHHVENEALLDHVTRVGKVLYVKQD